MNAQKECFGLTSKLCINKKQLISIKFQGIHVKLPRIEVGISREEDGNQYKAFLCVSLLVERQSVSIKFYGNKTEKVLSKQAFPFPKKPSALPEFGVEVNTVFRTIRFLISGEQVHDGDLPIPWASDIIEDMKFFVQLFDPGDCVRIID